MAPPVCHAGGYIPRDGQHCANITESRIARRKVSGRVCKRWRLSWSPGLPLRDYLHEVNWGGKDYPEGIPWAGVPDWIKQRVGGVRSILLSLLPEGWCSVLVSCLRLPASMLPQPLWAVLSHRKPFLSSMALIYHFVSATSQVTNPSPKLNEVWTECGGLFL